MIHQNTAEQIAAPEFSPGELQAMHRYCLRYRDLVRSDETPTPEQDETFLIFQRATYKYGVADGH